MIYVGTDAIEGIKKKEPNQSGVHIKTVKQTEVTEKKFTKNNIDLRKCLAEFTDGYIAEVLIPAHSSQLPEEYAAGNKIKFDIVFRRSGVLDEIKLIGIATDEDIPMPNNINGTAASIAIHIAKDIHVAKMNTDSSYEATEQNLFACADSIYKWIGLKLKN